jgi:hypothetical protein
MKNNSDAIGNRNRALPTCSAVPQPTVLPRAPTLELLSEKCPNGQCRLLNISRRCSSLNLELFMCMRRKTTVAFVMSLVYPSVYMEQLISHRTDFNEI